MVFRMRIGDGPAQNCDSQCAGPSLPRFIAFRWSDCSLRRCIDDYRLGSSSLPGIQRRKGTPCALRKRYMVRCRVKIRRDQARMPRIAEGAKEDEVLVVRAILHRADGFSGSRMAP